MQARGSITVVAFARHEELDSCLTAIEKARRGRKIPLIVVHQLGYTEVKRVILKHRKNIDILFETPALGLSQLENININGIISRQIAFGFLDSNWSLGIEDDTVIAPDSLDFIEYCYEKYKNNGFFRGVNLGSKMAFSEEMEKVYSRVSYGIHGQAAMVTDKTWKHFKMKNLKTKISTSGLDSLLENYLKSGFMCTPHNSRYLDHGWNGTHAPTDKNHEHFVSIQKSFTRMTTFDSRPFELKKYKVNWREDAHDFSVSKVPIRTFECTYNKIRHLAIKRIQETFLR